MSFTISRKEVRLAFAETVSSTEKCSLSHKCKGTSDLTVTGPFIILEAPGGLEPPVEALQAPALPALLRRHSENHINDAL